MICSLFCFRPYNQSKQDEHTPSSADGATRIASVYGIRIDVDRDDV